MIYKSFFRKKSTKVFVIAYILIFLTLGILLLVKDYCIKEANSYHEEDLVVVENGNNILLNSIKNIRKANNVLNAYSDYFEVFLEVRDDLKDNEIIVSDGKIGDIVNIIYNNKTYEFKIKSLNKAMCFTKIYISSFSFQKLENDKKSNYYNLKLKNWLKYQETLEILNYDKGFNVKTCVFNRDDYKDIFNLIVVFLYVIMIVFGVVGIFTCLNVVHDEKNNNRLYKILGYKKGKIIFITIKKLLLILISALLGSGFLIFLVKIIYFK